MGYRNITEENMDGMRKMIKRSGIEEWDAIEIHYTDGNITEGIYIGEEVLAGYEIEIIGRYGTKTKYKQYQEEGLFVIKGKEGDDVYVEDITPRSEVDLDKVELIKKIDVNQDVEKWKYLYTYAEIYNETQEGERREREYRENVTGKTLITRSKEDLIDTSYIKIEDRHVEKLRGILGEDSDSYVELLRYLEDVKDNYNGVKYITRVELH